MKPNLILYDTAEDILKLKDYLTPFNFIAYDLETTGLTARDEIVGFSVCAENDKAFYCILAKWSVELQRLEYVPGAKEAAAEVIRSLIGKSLIAHNGLFDCIMTESNFKISIIDSLHTCTMVLAHLLDENRKIGLKELAKQYLGEDSTQEQKAMHASVIANGGIWTKKNKEMYKASPYILGLYGAKDPWLTLQIFYILVEELYKQGLEKFFYEDESMPLLRGPTYQLNTSGLQVDLKGIAVLKKTLQAECLEAKDFIHQEILAKVKDKYPATNKKNTFNIGASQQLSWLLFGQLKLEFGTLTKGGKTVCKAMGLKLPYTAPAKRDFIYQCQARKDEIYAPEATVNGKRMKAKKVKDPWAYIAADKSTLKKFSSKLKWVEKLLEYNQKNKLLTTYVGGIERGVHYGIIQPSFLQTGTTSGRYSSRNPNFQNLPRDDKRIKSCIISRPNKVFVGADYSQLEPRVFAFTSGDVRLLEAFKSKNDFYSVTGMEVYDKLDCLPLKEGDPKAFGILYPKLRHASKEFTLASTYGATAPQLAPKMGISNDEAQRAIDEYFEKFPDVRQMMLDSHEQAKTQGFVTSYFGRPRRIPDAKKIVKLYGDLDHSELPYIARKLLNLSVNHRIQGTAASIVNRSAIAMHDNLNQANIDAKLALQVHDSLIYECLEVDAENVSALLQHSMENTIHLDGIALEAAPKIGKSLDKV